jgi:phage N-6-adenine-methyltransferase
MSIHHSFYSSRSEEWPTPETFYSALDDEFDFSLDPCASPDNAKCPTFFTKADDGLSRDWGVHRVFCNPPYGKTMRQWARKCFEASQRGATVVLLAHARTDTRWFHQWVYGKAAEIRFVKGRLRFGDGTQSAPFPSLIAVFKPSVDRSDGRTPASAPEFTPARGRSI